MLGFKRIYNGSTKDISRVSLQTFRKFGINTKQISLTTNQDSYRFGHTLSRKEQEWVVSEIVEHLRIISNSNTTTNMTKHAIEIQKVQRDAADI